jgi:DMSO/TMAO reductase YedYZ molybdopterin-dependent catalytic subunit
MTTRTPIHMPRRNFLIGAAAGVSGLAIGGGLQLSHSVDTRSVLGSAEALTKYWQRFAVSPGALAREFSERDIGTNFKANGSTDPEDAPYRALAASNFTEWRLEVGGLVERPGKYSISDLRGLPSRTQITRHDCVEGWSCIGKWKGVPLAQVVANAGLKPQARYLAFSCADTLHGSKYYETIDLIDAIHPQTILAYELNGQPLTVAHGAPLRLRVERQLGYKMAKYIMRIDAIDSYAGIQSGKGGFWEDRGYEWYAGI